MGQPMAFMHCTSITRTMRGVVTAAQAEIEQNANRAREELAGKVATLAVAGAEKLLEREVDADAHRDLLDKLAAEI